MKINPTLHRKSKFPDRNQGLTMCMLAFSLLGLLTVQTSFAQDDATKVSTKAFEFSAPKGWVVTELKLPMGPATQLIHTESQMRMIVQYLRSEKELSEEDKERAKNPCMLASSYVVPIAIKLGKKAGSKPILIFDRVPFGGVSGGGARVVVADPAHSTFETVHGISVQRGRDMFVAIIISKGRMDHVEGSQAHHDAVNQAYAMVSNMKLKVGEEGKQ